ncbi:NIPSNAP family protein [Brevundimonas sp.]|uniref:NIPSNAP family protein n=1 Tax=Brevundimonas sp. TaxID=1871086 RepID=UPI00260BA7EE|nr:NIPSNAP family protein [Brevundimonas sp.]
MLVELRTYTFEAGALPVFLAAYRAGPDRLQESILGDRVGYYVAETGDVNELVHLWRYESFEDRRARRAELAARPEWADFLRGILPLLKSQQSRILTPVELPHAVSQTQQQADG